MAILTRYRAQLNKGAKDLLEKETLLPAELPTLYPQIAAQKVLS